MVLAAISGAWGVGWLIVAAVGLPLLVRRRWPLPVLAVVVAAASVAAAAELLGLYNGLAGFVGAAMALHTVAVVEPDRRSRTALCVSLVAGGVGISLGAGGPDILGLLVIAVLLGSAWAAGRLIRARRRRKADEAERTAGETRTRERLRIAREMHDVVAHSLSLITVQAGVANHVATERPEEARDALRSIEETSRDALAETRRVLSVLREGPAEVGNPKGVGDPDELAELTGRAGINVELSVPNDAVVPAGPQETVYRIVQEALTNVVRHVGPTRCRVDIRADGQAVSVEVVDEGPAPGRVPNPPAPPGLGLIGMRERTMWYGGSFSAGPRPEGGFRVTVRLPVREER